MNSALQPTKIEANNVVLIQPRLAQGLNALRIQMGIKLLLIDIEPGRQPDQRGREQTAQQRRCDQDESMPRESF